MGIDLILISISYLLAFLIYYDGKFNYKILENIIALNLNNFLVILLFKICIYWIAKLYKIVWKHASIEEFSRIVFAVIFSTLVSFSYMYLKNDSFPLGINFLTFLLELVLMVGSRFFYKLFINWPDYSNINENQKRIMIIGGGDAGVMVINEYLKHKDLDAKVVVIIDDDPNKQGQIIKGVPILGTREDIVGLVSEKNIDEIIIAIPSASMQDIKKIVNYAKSTSAKLKIVPGIYELIDNKVTIQNIRNVDIEDLLGREPIELNLSQITRTIKDRIILVTGGGGSIGSELARQIARHAPKRLILLDNYENNMYEIQNELLRDFANLDLKCYIGSVRDEHRINEIMFSEKPEVVYHAAAHKHVPLMEENPKEAIKNNILGTQNLVRAADKHNVKKFVMISTDKAVNPTNIMGASKRVCEILVQTMNQVSQTEYVVVRFGNVLDSNGSVIPLFKKQIERGGPVTVTDRDVTRYFMTIPESVQLVIQAGAMAVGGEIFILDMGKPIKILDLAEDLIRLSGFKPYDEIPINIIGLRAGEKLTEELFLVEEDFLATKHHRIFISKPLYYQYNEINTYINEIRDNINNISDEEAKTLVFKYK